jgi:hypothetical protein
MAGVHSTGVSSMLRFGCVVWLVSTFIQFAFKIFDMRSTQDRQGGPSFFIIVAIVFLDNQEILELVGFKPLAETFPLPYTIYAEVELEAVVQVMIPIHLVSHQDGVYEIGQTSIDHEWNVLLLSNVVHHDILLGIVDAVEVFEWVHYQCRITPATINKFVSM